MLGHTGSRRSFSQSCCGEAQKSQGAAEKAELKCTDPQVPRLACLLLGEAEAWLSLCYANKKTSWADPDWSDTPGQPEKAKLIHHKQP